MRGRGFFPQRRARPNGAETDEKDENILVMERWEVCERER